MPAGTVAMARESGQVARMARAKPAAREPLNLREVAARAGVSHMTVSRVVRRPETVAEPTRRRVLAAMGREAAALIARALEGEEIGGTVRDLGFTLLPRASTARAAQ
jgi:DNA-binding LacI/PurR family transcriptional regulator